MTETIDRRTVIRTAAWVAPVIGLAVGTPLAQASPKCGKDAPVFTYNPKTTKINRGKNDKVMVSIQEGESITFTYLKDVDSINIQYKINDKTTVYHPNERAKAGRCVTIPLTSCFPVQWLRVHGNNVEYYGQGVFN